MVTGRKQATLPSDPNTHVMTTSWIHESFQSEFWENFEGEKISMFDVVYGRMREKVVLQQLIVIARLHHDPTDRTQLGAHYEKLNFELSKQHVWDRITGLLLIYPSCLLHVIESSGDILTSVLEDLNAMQQQPERGLSEAKIVFMAHNIESRLFEEWSYKVLSENQVVDSVEVRGHEENYESTEVLVCGVLAALQKLDLQTNLETPQKVLPGSVLDETPELIIPQRILKKLLCRDELISPERYLQMYKSPVNINMEFERGPNIQSTGFKTKWWNTAARRASILRSERFPE